jgi:hypothetical protein
MMLAAVETVTKADPVWASRRHNPDVAAQATARESIHASSPLRCLTVRAPLLSAARSPLIRERVHVAGPELVQQASRPLDIAEEKRDGPGRKVAHPSMIACRQ